MNALSATNPPTPTPPFLSRAQVSELQALFNATNGGVVLQNGLAFYPPPASPPDHNLYTLPDARGVLVEHFSVFGACSCK
jgi:hypothetical protein